VTGSRLSLTETASCRGRALAVCADGRLYVSRRYAIYRSDDRGESFALDCTVPAPAWRRIAASPRTIARLLRHDVEALIVLDDGARLAIARHGIYRAEPGSATMSRVYDLWRGSRPLNLAVGGGGRIVFGEYGDNPDRHEIHVYASDDGRRFDVAHTFAAGDVRHVHNLLWDAHLGKYWIFVGDYGREPGVGLMDAELSGVTWVARGSQQARAVRAIVEPDALVFGTDTDTERNHIVRLDKATGAMTTLCDLPGTSLYAARFGDLRMVSTCVEPGSVNPDRSARLFASVDGDAWGEVASFRKDPLSLRYFQFGTIVLAGGAAAAQAMFSGQAVAGLDDRVRIVSAHVEGRGRNLARSKT
jgi:hypothetical protein